MSQVSDKAGNENNQSKQRKGTKILVILAFLLSVGQSSLCLCSLFLTFFVVAASASEMAESPKPQEGSKKEEAKAEKSKSREAGAPGGSMEAKGSLNPTHPTQPSKPDNVAADKAKEKPAAKPGELTSSSYAG